MKSTLKTIVVLLFCFGALATCSAQKVSKLSLSPSSVFGGMTSTGTVTLSSKAGSQGFIVALSSSSSAVSLPDSVTVEAGKTIATFTVTTSPVVVSSVSMITAQVSGTKTSANLTIKPPTLSAFVISTISIPGGDSPTGTVTISGNAPTSGLKISLSSTSTVVAVPSNVTIAQGEKSATFSVSTVPVSKSESAKVTAKLSNGSIGVTLSVTPPTITSVAISPTAVSRGASATGTITLSSPAPTTGLKLSLSSNQTAAKVPSSVTVEAGATTAPFTVSSVAISTVVTATITAKTPAGSSGSAKLTVGSPSPFAGRYVGSFSDDAGDAGGFYFNISSSGGITGAAVDMTYAAATTISGTINALGVVNIKGASAGFKPQNGTFQLTDNTLTGTLSNGKVQTAVSLLATVGGPVSNFAGALIGTFSGSQGAPSGTVTLLVDANGNCMAVAATSKGADTASGTITADGQTSLTNSEQIISTGTLMLSASGKVTGTLFGTDGSKTVLTLKLT